MSITSQNTGRPSLAVEVLLALDEIQALGPRLQNEVSLGSPYTAIIWRDGRLCYEGCDSAAQVEFVDGILIGAVGVITNKPFGWALNTSASIADPSLPLREVWADLLTGKKSELAGTMLALGVIPSDYDLGDLCIDAGSFVFATAQLDDDNMLESYVRILEAQVEELCAPLAVTGLNSAEAGAIADQIWFETDVLAACLKSAIDRLDRLTTISEALELARYNLARAF